MGVVQVSSPFADLCVSFGFPAAVTMELRVLMGVCVWSSEASYLLGVIRKHIIICPFCCVVGLGCLPFVQSNHFMQSAPFLSKFPK